MQIHTLQREHGLRKKKRVGRGGKRGKTSGRGTKGQKARSGHKMRPELRDIIKKIPKLRGRGKNSQKSTRIPFSPVNLILLEKRYADGEIVSPATLREKKIVSSSRGKFPRVKILGTGSLSKKLIFESCSFSASAKEAVSKAGGTIR